MSSLDSDKPKNNAQEDRFQRYEFAKRIARIINNNILYESLVIGIYGKWGEGKTSIMNFIKAELSNETIIINFNPWLFSDQEQLIKSFLNSIAFEMEKSLATGKEKVGKILSDYGDAVSTVTKYFGVSLEGLKNIGDKLQKVSVEKLKERVDEMIRSTGKKIVICVDDIDRLDVKEIQYIFKLVKLVGDFPNTSYMLAFDEEMIATALAPQYGNGHKSNGYQFLEKIIQLPLKIPKATHQALKKYTIDMLNGVLQELEVTISQKEVNKFREVFDEHFVSHLDNPRLAIRYANAIHFALPLLYKEVDTPDLMLLEGLKIFFPAAYDFTRYNSSIFLTNTVRQTERNTSRVKTKDQILRESNEFLVGLQEKDKESVKAIWQALFPQYRYTTINRGYRDDKWRDWYKEKRICSGGYFERYFTYVVQTDDISDVQFDQFLSDLETSTLQEAEEKMALFFQSNDVADIIFKIRLWESELSTQQSKTLSLLLAKKSNQLPVEAGEFSTFTTNAEGAKIVAQLIANLPASERLLHIKTLVSESANFEFAMEIVYYINYKEGKSSEKILAEDEQGDLKEYLITHFKVLNQEKAFFDILPDTEAWRILSWWKEIDLEGLQKTIEKVLVGGGVSAVNLIKVFTPTITSWGGKETRSYKSGFNKTNYESMISSIDVKQVYDVLKNDPNTNRKEYDLEKISDRDALSDDDLINIFMQFFEEDTLFNN